MTERGLQIWMVVHGGGGEGVKLLYIFLADFIKLCPLNLSKLSEFKAVLQIQNLNLAENGIWDENEVVYLAEPFHAIGLFLYPLKKH